jgi:predicted ATP-grasp superfamily ATP-dependent carboligase
MEEMYSTEPLPQRQDFYTKALEKEFVPRININENGDGKLKMDPTHPPALVIGVDVSALNVIRSLGGHGIEVYTMGRDTSDYGAASRYAKFVLCDDLTDEKKVISKLLEISRNLGRKMVLFCTSDLHVLHVSRNREVLKPFFEFVLPDHEVIETLMDKKNFNDFANRHGFSVPKTFFSKNSTDFQKVASSLPYPCVIKPLYRTIFWSLFVPPEKKVMKADSPQDLRQKLSDLRALDIPLIFQEWIPGGDQQVYFCLAYLDRYSKPLALLAGRKLRQYPSLTGVTSLAESITNPKMAEITLEVLSTARCTGLCSMEFKYDASDDSFKITEPTVGRVDLQEGISTQAGLDIPFIAYQDALGIPQSGQIDYEKGVKWINEPFEFNALLSHGGENGHRVRTFFHPYQGGHHSFALLSLHDPMPFLRFLTLAGKRGFRYLKKAVLSL